VCPDEWLVDLDGKSNESGLHHGPLANVPTDVAERKAIAVVDLDVRMLPASRFSLNDLNEHGLLIELAESVFHRNNSFGAA
jgi:hypothetical protein